MDVRMAIPSVFPGGLQSQVAGHFGRCDLFTVVEIQDGQVASTTILPNPPHQQGGCMAPVALLAEKGVAVMIAGGMGQRPLAGFQQAGIQVFRCTGSPEVGTAVEAFLKGELASFGQDHTCRGHDHGHAH